MGLYQKWDMPPNMAIAIGKMMIKTCLPPIELKTGQKRSDAGAAGG
jgi:hypothetical protein